VQLKAAAQVCNHLGAAVVSPEYLLLTVAGCCSMKNLEHQSAAFAQMYAGIWTKREA